MKSVPLFSSKLICCLAFLLGFTGSAFAQYPRLLINATRLAEIQTAVQVPGSSHKEMYEVMKAEVDAKAADVIGGGDRSGDNWNYARNHMARQAAMLYAISGEASYAQLAYDALYAVHNDPDPGNVVPEAGKGLERAMVGTGFAIAYDLCYNGWTPAQRAYIKGKIDLALTNWKTFGFINVDNPPYGSNWVAVCRGAELLMMLSVYGGSSLPDQARANQLKSWLTAHMNNYGDGGWSQEGNQYTPYGGLFLFPALIALRNHGDTSLDATAASRNFHRVALYGGMFDASQDSTQWGVGGHGFGYNGWQSLLFEMVPASEKPYYKWFYDRHCGILNPAPPTFRYDHTSMGNVYALMFYPENLPSQDPTGVLPAALQESQGGYWIRDGWKDADDLIVFLGADTSAHPYGWDEADALQINILANGTKFAGGPGASRLDRLFSQVLVNGRAHTSNISTGKLHSLTHDSQGGYAIADGGGKFGGMGMSVAQRHVKVDFADENGHSLVSVYDKMRGTNLSTLTWQLNQLGLPFHSGVESGVPTFTIESESGGYLKGWVLHPRNVVIRADSPLRFDYYDSEADFLVVMVTGKDAAPHAVVAGEDLDSTLQIGSRRVRFDTATERIITEALSTQIPMARFHSSLTSGNPPLTVNFDATDSSDPQGGNLSYHWDFGGLGTSTSPTPSFAFSPQGFHTVTLTVTGPQGNSAQASTRIEVLNQNPLAVLSASVLVGEPPLVVQFSGAGSSDPDGHPLSYAWDFGDGASGSGDSVSHTYTTQGAYFPVLTVMDPYGGRSTSSVQIKVGNQAPAVDFTSVASVTMPPVSVSFDASATVDPEGDTLSYHWDFGDGNTASGVQVTHPYAAFGSYDVVLTVNDGQGNTVIKTRNLTLANRNPVARMTASVIEGRVPLAVSFNASGSSDPEGQPLIYTWDFKDGNTGSGLNTSHTFHTPGHYLVVLRVQDTGGAFSEDTIEISVQDSSGRRAPENPSDLYPGIYYEYYSLPSRYPPDFDKLTLGSEGVMNNISISNRPNTHRYAFRFSGYFYAPADGTYTFSGTSMFSLQVLFGNTVVLPYTTKFNGSFSIALAQGYHRIEIRHHTGNVNPGEEPPHVNLNVAGPGFAARPLQDGDLFWKSGRAKSSFLVSTAPENLLLAPTVNFLPEFKNGAQHFYTPQNGNAVTLNFSAGPSFAPNSEIVSYLWDFGDGTAGSGQTVSKTFTTSGGNKGSYVVSLTVVSADGGVVKSVQTLQILQPPADINRAREFGKSVIASGEDPAANAFAVNAFDGDPTYVSRWMVIAEGGWIELHFNHNNGRQKYVIDRYAVTNPNDWNDRDPKEILFQASNDGSNWTTLDHQTDLVWPSSEYRWVFPITNTAAYSSYRWEMVQKTGTRLEVQEIEILDGGSSTLLNHQPPVASFIAPPLLEAKQEWTFDASASYDPENYPLMFFWDFGDGQTAITFDSHYSYTYYVEGQYTATLTVRDSLDKLHSTSHGVVVGPSTNQAPVAAISLTMNGSEALLDGSASMDPDGDPLTYLWDFGDKSASTRMSPTHSYAPGLFSATLTVMDGRGGVSTATVVVDNRPVNQPLSVGLNFALYSEPYLIQPFQYAGAVPAAFWNNLHAGTTASSLTDSAGNNSGMSLSMSHENGIGTRRANATSPVNSPDGALVCSSIGTYGDSYTVYLSNIPYAEYDLYLYTAGIVSSGFTDQAGYMEVGGVKKWMRDSTGTWDYSLNESAATTAAEAVDGSEYVVFRNLIGNSQTIYVKGFKSGGMAGFQVVDRSDPNLPPVAQIAANPLTGDSPLLVSFDATGSSDPDGSIASYEWDVLGDGNWIPGNGTTSYTYLYPGTYTAKVKVIDDRGAATIATLEINVTGIPPPAAPTNLSASNVSHDSVSLQWVDHANNESGFRIERAPAANGPWTHIATPAANSSSYTDSTVAASTTYAYRVTAWNAIGTSSPSNALVVTTPAMPGPPVITTQPQSQSVFVGQPVVFAVTASGNPAPSYQWRKNGVDIPNANQASYSIPAAALTDAAQYRVFVNNGIGSGVQSNIATLAVIEPPPSALLLEEYFDYGASVLDSGYGSWQDNTGKIKYVANVNGSFSHAFYDNSNNVGGSLWFDWSGNRGVQLAFTTGAESGTFWVSALIRHSSVDDNTGVFIALHDSANYSFADAVGDGFGIGGNGTEVVPVLRNVSDRTYVDGTANGLAVNTFYLLLAKVTVGEGPDSLSLWVKKAGDSFDATEASLGAPALTSNSVEFGSVLKNIWVGQDPSGGYVDAIRISGRAGNVGLADVLGQAQQLPPNAPVVSMDRNGSGFDLTFESEVGVFYQLEEAPTLDGPWNEVEGMSFFGDGSVIIFYVTGPLYSDDQIFYRIHCY